MADYGTAAMGGIGDGLQTAFQIYMAERRRQDDLSDRQKTQNLNALIHGVRLKEGSDSYEYTPEKLAEIELNKKKGLLESDIAMGKLDLEKQKNPWEIKKLKADAMKAESEAQVGPFGKIQKESLDRASDLRKEFSGTQTVKDTAIIANAYQKIKDVATKPPSPAGDMSLVFSYMKLLDPNSTVREGEYANAQNAAGVPDRVLNAYNSALRGEILNPKQRQDFVGQAGNLFSSQRERLKPIEENYKSLSGRYGVDPTLVVPDYGYDKLINTSPVKDKSSKPKTLKTNEIEW